MRIWALALVSTGCAQLFGLSDTSSSGRATLELRRVSIGATVVTGPLDLGTAVPTFEGATGNLPGMMTAPGTWSAGISGATGVVYTAPDLPTPFQHALELGTQITSADFVVLEHPNPKPAPASSWMVDVTLPAPYAAGETLEILAIGAWTHHVLAGAELPAPGAPAISTTIPNASFVASAAGKPARITMQDQVVVVRYTAGLLSGAFIVPMLDQTDGSDPITGTMVAAAPDTPFDATISPTTVAGRFAAVHPASSGLAQSWFVVASPGHAQGVAAGVTLDGGAIAMADTSFSASVANPFAQLDWKPLLGYTTSETRTFMLGGAALGLTSSLTTIAAPAPGLVLDLPAGLATSVALGGTALDTDGMTVTVDPTKPVTVDITADRPNNTAYQVTLDEIAVVGASVTQTPVIAVTGTTPHLTLPANVVQRGHTYTLVAACVTGYPNAASGDLQTVALPMTSSSVPSGVFTIAP